MTPKVDKYWGTAEGCRIMFNALRQIDVMQARQELRFTERVTVWTSASSLLLLSIWTLLTVLRSRARKHRRLRVIMDVICVLLASAALTSAAFGSYASSQYHIFRFEKAVRNALPDDAKEFYGRIWSRTNKKDSCMNEHKQASGIKTGADRARVIERSKLLRRADTNAPLFPLATAVCTSAFVLLFVSLINTVMNACVKPRPENNNNRIWTGGSNNAPADGAMPPSQAVEHFMQYIDLVPPSTDAVVLGATGEGADCRICLEVLLDDIAKLHACQHTFHRRCILRWLINSNDPTCPLCKEPLQTNQPAVELHADDPDSSPSVHVHSACTHNSQSQTV